MLKRGGDVKDAGVPSERQEPRQHAEREGEHGTDHREHDAIEPQPPLELLPRVPGARVLSKRQIGIRFVPPAVAAIVDLSDERCALDSVQVDDALLAVQSSETFVQVRRVRVSDPQCSGQFDETPAHIFHSVLGRIPFGIERPSAPEEPAVDAAHGATAWKRHQRNNAMTEGIIAIVPPSDAATRATAAVLFHSRRRSCTSRCPSNDSPSRCDSNHSQTRLCSTTCNSGWFRPSASRSVSVASKPSIADSAVRSYRSLKHRIYIVSWSVLIPSRSPCERVLTFQAKLTHELVPGSTISKYLLARNPQSMQRTVRRLIMRRYGFGQPERVAQACPSGPPAICMTSRVSALTR